MAEKINPIGAELRLAQILGDDYLAQAPESARAAGAVAGSTEKVDLPNNIFEDVLSRAIESLNDVSRSEVRANQLIDGYLRGEVELHEVMLAQSKMSVMVQLAVTAVNSAVTSFKEITQMQV